MIDLKNFDVNEIENLLKKIPEFIGKLKDKLPLLDNIEKGWRLENKLSDDTMILYTAVKSPNNDKIMIYVFGGTILKEQIDTPTLTIAKGTMIIDKKIKAIDAFEFAESISANGINGLIDLIM